MATAQGIRAGAAYVELSVKDSRLIQGLRSAERKLKAFGAGIAAIGRRMLALGASIAAPLLATTRVFGQMGDDLAKMSARTGVSVESLSELGYAADQSGANLDTLETGLRRMQQVIVAAAGGAGAATEALTRLGLSVSELASLSPEDQLKRIADRLEQIRNPALKTALAMELFGRSGTRLLPMLARGAQGIEALQERARALGLTMATEDAQAAEVFNDTLDDLWKVLKRAAFAIGASLAPMLTNLAKTLTSLVVSSLDWIKNNKDLVVGGFMLAAAVAAGGAALIALGTAIAGTGAMLGMIATVIAGIGSALAALLSPIGLVSAGVVALAGYLLYATGVGGQAIAWLAGVFTDLKNDALAAFQGIADALAAGDIGLAAKVLWLTLKMEWQKGVHALREIWVGFKEIFLSVWTEAVFGLSRILTKAWAGLQAIWTETVAALSAAWTVFSSGAVSAWKTAQNFIAKGIVRLMGLLDSSVDVDATLAALNEDFQREQEARQRDTAQQLAGIESARQQRLGEIESQRAGTLAALEEDRQRAHAERQRRFSAELEKSAEALAAAQKEWQDALAEAAAKRGAAARSAVPERVRQAELDLAGLDEVIDATQRKVEAAGTFNPFAIGGLGADSLSQRTAKASEEIAANTKRLLHEAQHGKLVFA